MTCAASGCPAHLLLCCRHGSAAAPHFVATHYQELVGEKGIVLVRGDIIHPNAVSIGEVRSGR
jgi:hypothetical protein